MKEIPTCIPPRHEITDPSKFSIPHAARYQPPSTLAAEHVRKPNPLQTPSSALAVRLTADQWIDFSGREPRPPFALDLRRPQHAIHQRELRDLRSLLLLGAVACRRNRRAARADDRRVQGIFPQAQAGDDEPREEDQDAREEHRGRAGAERGDRRADEALPVGSVFEDADHEEGLGNEEVEKGECRHLRERIRWGQGQPCSAR